MVERVHQYTKMTRKQHDAILRWDEARRSIPSAEQLAQELGVPPRAVLTWLHNFKKKLRVANRENSAV